MNKKALIPLGIFGVLLVFLAIGLTRDPHEIPSALIGKPASLFTAPRLDAPGQTFSSKDMLGKVWILNTWGSWCVTCRLEHPFLLELSKTKAVPIIGLDWRDKDEDGLRWLARFGNPYDVVATDNNARIGIDFGVTAAPESFVIDKTGVIRYKQNGMITPEVLRDTILPLIQELQK
jgi:cytochrome c biogenesis protein CcmG/thiol:disulfide interchange protein DsbE